MNDCKDTLKSNVLGWLRTLRLSDQYCRYQFNKDSDDTIFCTCFALFILDLFKETNQFSDNERKQWTSHIQSFQNKEHGYFEPEVYYHTDKERNCYQLTCFCLSALKILETEPKFPLKFIEQWKTPEDIKTYLLERGCHEGRPGSGNKAMFLAIFLTYQYERTKESHLLEKIDAWFDFHNKTQNRNGFWGSDMKSLYLHGLQNGFHQFVIYFYWQKEVPKIHNIIDITLMSQDRQGYFAPTPGGEACHDYDAIHILAMAHRITDYRKDEIEESLRKAFVAILKTGNSDGGFCQSKSKMINIFDFIRHVPFYLTKRPSYLWYYRARSCFATMLKRKDVINTGWTEKPRFWNESNLWDSWFRCLTLAEIAHTIDDKVLESFRNVSFHEAPGLGQFLLTNRQVL